MDKGKWIKDNSNITSWNVKGITTRTRVRQNICKKCTNISVVTETKKKPKAISIYVII